MDRTGSQSGRRERAKREKQDRIMRSAQELFAEHGVSGVTTQQIAERADVAIGTLFLYAATKAELLIMVQNEKFASAINRGVDAAGRVPHDDALGRVMALLLPVVSCVREQVENGRTYLHELVFGDPREPFRQEGLRLSAQLEAGIAAVLQDADFPAAAAPQLARVCTAILHVSTTATMHLDYSLGAIVDDIRSQIAACLRDHHAPAATTA